jgi:hypothetical protein
MHVSTVASTKDLPHLEIKAPGNGDRIRVPVSYNVTGGIIDPGYPENRQKEPGTC